jgi:Ethanolamine utilization protein EutJ (predicted chaperonin)
MRLPPETDEGANVIEWSLDWGCACDVCGRPPCMISVVVVEPTCCADCIDNDDVARVDIGSGY